MDRKNVDCWICQSLVKDPHLVFYKSRTSVAKLNPDQFFLGYTFVTLKRHAVELYHLGDEERVKFLDDMSLVSKALADVFKPDKMNYELLGNGQPHMHWHLIPRYRSDPLWGRPIWSGGTRRKRLDREAYDGLVGKLKARLDTAS